MQPFAGVKYPGEQPCEFGRDVPNVSGLARYVDLDGVLVVLVCRVATKHDGETFTWPHRSQYFGAAQEGVGATGATRLACGVEVKAILECLSDGVGVMAAENR